MLPAPLWKSEKLTLAQTTLHLLSGHVEGKIPPDPALLALKPAAEEVYGLVRGYFLDRTDILAFKPPATWELDVCPAVAGDQLRDLVFAHVTGEPYPVRWKTLSGRSGTTEPIAVRLGTYSPAPDGSTVFGCVDFDGGGHHSASLADPLGAALAFLGACRDTGLVAHLERSGGGEGYHVWAFFSKPVAASVVRRVLFGLLPSGLKLARGGDADARKNVGVEVFPKQDHIGEGGVGNMVWLPWWHGAVEGGNLFYRADDTGEAL